MPRMTMHNPRPVSDILLLQLDTPLQNGKPCISAGLQCTLLYSGIIEKKEDLGPCRYGLGLSRIIQNLTFTLPIFVDPP